MPICDRCGPGQFSTKILYLCDLCAGVTISAKIYNQCIARAEYAEAKEIELEQKLKTAEDFIRKIAEDGDTFGIRTRARKLLNISPIINYKVIFTKKLTGERSFVTSGCFKDRQEAETHAEFMTTALPNYTAKIEEYTDESE